MLQISERKFSQEKMSTQKKNAHPLKKIIMACPLEPCVSYPGGRGT